MAAASSSSSAVSQNPQGQADLKFELPSILEDSAYEEPGALQVISGAKRCRLTVPVFLNMVPETLDTALSFPVRESEFQRRNLDSLFETMEDTGPTPTVFPASLFVPARLLDMSVPYFRFNYEDVKVREEADHMRVLFNVFTYSIALMQKARDASPDPRWEKDPNRGKVEVVIEPVPAPGYNNDDWQTVGPQALAGFFFHAWVQMGEPIHDPAADGFGSDDDDDDEDLDEEDAKQQALALDDEDGAVEKPVSFSSMDREHKQQRQAMRNAHSRELLDLKTQCDAECDALEDPSERGQVERQWRVRITELEVQHREALEDLITEQHVVEQEREHAQARYDEWRAQRQASEADRKQQVAQERLLRQERRREQQAEKRRRKQQRKAFKVEQSLLARFFSARGLLSRDSQRVEPLVAEMLGHVHRYSADTCMCLAIQLLSQQVVWVQHNEIVARMDRSDPELAKIKLYRDLVANAAHLALDGVFSDTRSFYAAIEWYLQTVADFSVPLTDYATAAQAWLNPGVDGAVFENIDALRGVQFRSIFHPARAYMLASREHARMCHGTPHRPRALRWPGYTPDFASPAFRVQPSDFSILSNGPPVPPLLYHYYLHTVIKYMRTPASPPPGSAAARRLVELKAASHDLEDNPANARVVEDPACVEEDDGAFMWLDSDFDEDNDDQQDDSKGGSDHKGNNLHGVDRRVLLAEHMTCYMGVQNSYAALGFFYQMQSRIRKRISKILNLDQQDDMTYEELYWRRTKAMDYFRGIWSKSADLPSATLAVVHHLSNLMHTYDGRIFRHRMPFQSPELSPFQHYITRLFSALDIFMGAHVSHNIIVLMYTGAQHVFSTNRKAWLHPHVLFRGSHGAGKSHAVKIMKKLLVPGTYIELEHISTHTFTVTGDDTNCMVVCMEEADFVRNDTKAQPAQGGLQSASTGTNILKNIFDARESGSGRYVEGKREITRIECNMQFTATTNTPENETNLAMQDRMAVVELLAREDTMRRDRKNAADSERMAFDRQQALELKERGNDFVEIEQLLHTLTTLAYTMMGREGELLPHVNLEVVREFRQLWGQLQSPFLVTDDTRTTRIDEQNQAARKYERLNSVCEVWTIRRALVLTFMCPNSPFPKDHKFCLEDMLALAPLLATPVEVLYFALGLLYREFIDSKAILVLRAITQWMRRYQNSDCFLIRDGAWKDYYRLGNFIALYDTETRSASGRSFSMIGGGDDDDQNQDQAAAASTNTNDGQVTDSVVGAVYEPPAVRAARAESAAAGPILHNYQSRHGVPQHQYIDASGVSGSNNNSGGGGGDQKREAAAAAREFSGRKAMASNATDVLFNVVKRSGATVMIDPEIHKTLRRLGDLHVEAEGWDALRHKRIMAIHSNDSTTFDLYVHKSVFRLKHPSAEFFDLVDKALGTAVQATRVMMTGVPVPLDPESMQRRLLAPSRNETTRPVWNGQLVSSASCHSWDLDYSKKRQNMYVETDKDIDVKGIKLALEHLRLRIPETPSFALLTTELRRAHSVAGLPRAIPIDPLLQTIELFDIPNSVPNWRERGMHPAYYDQLITLKSFYKKREDAKDQLVSQGVDPFSRQFQPRLRGLINSFVANQLKRQPSTSIPGVTRYQVELEPFVRHFEDTKNEIRDHIEMSNMPAFDMNEMFEQLPVSPPTAPVPAISAAATAVIASATRALSRAAADDRIARAAATLLDDDDDHENVARVGSASSNSGLVSPGALVARDQNLVSSDAEEYKSDASMSRGSKRSRSDTSTTRVMDQQSGDEDEDDDADAFIREYEEEQARRAKQRERKRALRKKRRRMELAHGVYESDASDNDSAMSSRSRRRRPLPDATESDLFGHQP